MRRPPRIVAFVVLLCLAALAAPQLAIADRIAAQSEFDCVLNDTSPRLHTVTVWHKFNTGKISSRFKIEIDPGVTMTYLSESVAWPATGDMRNGITVCYLSCQVGDVVIGTIEFQGYGTSAMLFRARGPAPRRRDARHRRLREPHRARVVHHAPRSQSTGAGLLLQCAHRSDHVPGDADGV